MKTRIWHDAVKGEWYVEYKKFLFWNRVSTYNWVWNEWRPKCFYSLQGAKEYLEIWKGERERDKKNKPLSGVVYTSEV